MPILDLSIDALLTTTRTVRKRLDLARPVEPEVIRECLELALQAPTASYSQDWHFVVVTDPQQRQALATLYRKGAARYMELMAPVFQQRMASSEQEGSTLSRIIGSGQYLIEHLPIIAQAARWGSIMPATWSFMLAARSRGLGSSLTSFHLFFEQEAAEVLGIPYEEVMQAGLIPVAYTLGTEFKPAARKPLASVLHWDRW